MTFIACGACQELFDAHARRCPHCGTAVGGHRTRGAALALMLTVGLVGCPRASRDVR
jgi:hypothetical protein